MKSIIIVISFVIVIASLASCAGSIPNPTETDAEWASHTWSGMTVHHLMKGRKLYIEKCGSCHSLSAPAQYSVQEWGRIMEKMKIKAAVSEEEKNLMMKYLVTMREVQKTKSER